MSDLNIKEKAALESEERDERIQMRRGRIKKRVEESKREAMGEQPGPDENNESEGERDRRSKKQVEESKQRLEKLVSDGTQLVTNVQVAGDAKEVQRRTEEDESKKTRYEKLEAEANASVERFEEIMRRWEPALSKKIPQDLQEMLVQQRTACDAMKDEKDKLINDFQQELKSKDDQYVRDLKKQAEDVDLILERMEDQVKTLMKGYREELEEIEKAFVAERARLLQLHIDAWNKGMEGRRLTEQENLQKRETSLDEHERQLQHLRQQNAEDYKQIKMNYEKKIQNLQQEIELMKATFQLNTEKLEYNFHVLKKRDEENMITISQQKRKITKLQDVLTNLRKKLAKQEEQHQVESSAITEEYKKNTQQFADLQKKYKLFQAADVKKFEEVWRMTEDNVREVATVVQQGDRVIHQHQMGLEWEPSELPDSPMNQTSSAQADNNSVSQALQYVASVLSEGGSNSEHSTSTMADSKPSPGLVQHVLNLVCQESSFLIEEKLLRLLAPLEDEEKLLMKLDSVFKALQIVTEEDIHKLVGYCLEPVEADEETDQQSNVQIVHPNEVAKALRRFAEERKNLSKPVSALNSSKVPITQRNSSLLDGKFWEDMSRSVLPESHEKVIDALLQGLEKYHSVLESRHDLLQDTDRLKQQNTELKLLLHQYMHARINQELEIPPTLGMMNNPAQVE